MHWNLKKPPVLRLAAYKNRLGISSILAKVLLNRGVSLDTAEKELHDPLALIEDPLGIAGAEAAAGAILEQCGKNKKFIIFADYDVDGLTSGFVMTDFLRSIGESAHVFYPERSEGYGLSKDFAEVMASTPNAVVITVDNGITKVDEVAYLNDHDVPVIITDHHEPQAVLPDCPICDAWQDKNSAGHHLCGAAIAWKVCMLLEDKMQMGSVEKYLPYVAIATIADVMPMTPENIALVNLGIEAINNGASRTISALMEMLDIKKLTPEDIAWMIAPKLNACGRMGEIDTAGDLFFMEQDSLTDIKDQIRDILELDDTRTAYTKKAQKEIDKLDYSKDHICLFDATDYPAGIAGIIAGKIAERFGKPAFVYTTLNAEVYPASARSIPGIDLGVLLAKEVEAGYIASWGGHAQACGAALCPDKLNEFRTSMNAQIEAMLQDGALEIAEPVLDIDAEISIRDLNADILKEIESLPYDRSTFTAPVFCMKNIKVAAKQPYSNKNHLVLECEDEHGGKITLVSWNNYPAYEAIGCPEKVDIAGKICTVGFPDRTTKRKATDVTIRIEDIRAAV